MPICLSGKLANFTNESPKHRIFKTFVMNDSDRPIRLLTVLETRGKSLTGAVRSVRYANQALRCCGVEQIFLGCGSIGEMVVSYRELKRLAGAYDVVLINGLRPLAERRAVSWFARRCLRRGIPVGVYWHETQESFNFLDQVSQGRLSKTTSLIRHQKVFHLVTSEKAKTFTQTKIDMNATMHCVYECVPDPDEMSWLKTASLSMTDDRPLVFAAGTIIPRKGCDLLVDVCRQVVQTRPDVIFAWAGTSSSQEVEKLKKQIDQASVASNFIMLDYQDPPYLWQRAAKVIAQPSRNDPLPISLMEGLALRRPAVCFDVDGFPEILGDAGSVIKPFDTVAFAEAILYWLDCAEAHPRHESSRRVYEIYGHPDAFAKRFAQAIRSQTKGA